MAREPSGGGTLHYFLGEEILKPLSAPGAALGRHWGSGGWGSPMDGVFRANKKADPPRTAR